MLLCEALKSIQKRSAQAEFCPLLFLVFNSLIALPFLLDASKKMNSFKAGGRCQTLSSHHAKFYLLPLKSFSASQREFITIPAPASQFKMNLLRKKKTKNPVLLSRHRETFPRGGAVIPHDHTSSLPASSHQITTAQRSCVHPNLMG